MPNRIGELAGKSPLSNTIMQFVLWPLVIAVLAACTSTPAPSNVRGASLTYAEEQFPVLIVDRTKFPEKFQPARLPNDLGVRPGTILIDSKAKLLYFAETRDTVLRYGIAVGAAGRAWYGEAKIGRKAKWPTWYPTDEMRADTPGLPNQIPSGLENPLGARALYLYADGRDTLYRIHGTSEPWTIGTDASSGCIRMLNEDIIALYDKVEAGAKVVVR